MKTFNQSLQNLITKLQAALPPKINLNELLGDSFSQALKTTTVNITEKSKEFTTIMKDTTPKDGGGERQFIQIFKEYNAAIIQRITKEQTAVITNLAKLKWFLRTTTPWLIVCDNVDHMKSFKLFASEMEHYKNGVLIVNATTHLRYSDWSSFKQIQVIAGEHFSPSDFGYGQEDLILANKKRVFLEVLN